MDFWPSETFKSANNAVLYLQDSDPSIEIRSELSFHHHSKQQWQLSDAFPVVLIPTLGARKCSRLHTTHVPTAFLAAAARTELRDDANRSKGQTYHVRTVRDGPYAAAGIVVCTTLSLLTRCAYASLNNSNRYNYWVVCQNVVTLRI